MPPRPLKDDRRPTREDFIRPDLATGTLRTPDDRRTAVLPALFVGQLHHHLAGDDHGTTRHSLYKFGYESSLQSMVLLSRQLHAEFAGGNLDLWQMDAKFILDRWWAPHASGGWGNLSFDLSSLASGFAFAELRDSAIVAAVTAESRPTEPVCHYYAGLVAGALSFFERTERHAIEFQCAALGAPACRFAIGPGSHIDEAELWRKQGIAPDEIRRRLS